MFFSSVIFRIYGASRDTSAASAELLNSFYKCRQTHRRQ